MKAIWNGVVVAESDDIVTVEGEHYFPQAALKSEYTSFSNHRTSAWQGPAHYQSLRVSGGMRAAAAWHAPPPNESAANLKDRVAFTAGVAIVA